MDWNQIVKPIMAGLKKHEPFPWPRTDAGRLKIIGTLQELLPNDDIPKACLGLSNEAMNRRLRELISPYLKSSDQELTAQLAIWIVKQWGGIHRGTNSIPKWCRDLSGFNHKAVASFVSQIGIARISSWSKIIAFAEPTTYAIYDARTTIAINCRLHDIGYREGFFMPTGRNTHVEPAARLLKQTNFKITDCP